MWRGKELIFVFFLHRRIAKYRRPDKKLKCIRVFIKVGIYCNSREFMDSTIISQLLILPTSAIFCFQIVLLICLFREIRLKGPVDPNDGCLELERIWFLLSYIYRLTRLLVKQLLLNYSVVRHYFANRWLDPYLCVEWCNYVRLQLAPCTWFLAVR